MHPEARLAALGLSLPCPISSSEHQSSSLDRRFRRRTGERFVRVNREYMLLANAVPEEASLVI